MADECLREEMLIKVSAADNNNKFYHLRLMSDGSVHKRWGRVGAEGQSMVENGGSHRYDTVRREKERHGYNPVNLVTTNTSATQHKTNNSDLRTVARSALVTSENKGNIILEALIERLVASNRHEILVASGGMIKINTDGVMTTPLGMVSDSSIADAECILQSIESAGRGNAPVSLLEKYLTLIPQRVRTVNGWYDGLFDGTTSFTAQNDLLKQLRDSYAWYEAERTAAVKSPISATSVDERYKSLFKMTISPMSVNTPEFSAIKKMYEKGKNPHHPSAALNVKNVFTLSNPTGDEAYTKVLSKIGNEQRLWHGTRVFNVLSILRKGLFIPPVHGTTIATTGRMFGDGVYFSDQSTKSLNYSYGTWGGAATRDNNCFMFLADVAMGWEFQPNRQNISRLDMVSLRKAYNGKDINGKQFNSISVKGGTCGVLNNEMIIWKTDQIKLPYLVEFAR